MRTLYFGLTGDDVLSWQVFLRGLKPDSNVIVNGVFDAVTKLETQAFQRAVSLGADGIVGPKTMGMAMTMGFDPLNDDGLEEYGPNWPAPPNHGSLSPVDRAKLFGTFAYRSAPVAGNPEAIVVTDSWYKSNIVTVDVPQLVNVASAPRTHKIEFHKAATVQLQCMWQAWADAGLLGRVLSWGGSYAPRFIRGSRVTLSNHAWGTAFDINVAWNMLGARPALKGQRGSVRDLVEIAYQHGFYWGGWFKTRPDGMHFECYTVRP